MNTYTIKVNSTLRAWSLRGSIVPQLHRAHAKFLPYVTLELNARSPLFLRPMYMSAIEI